MSQQNFIVSAKDKQTGREMKISVGRGQHAANQEEAEVYIATLSPAQGGSHPGFEINPVDAEKFKARLAEATAQHGEDK